METRFREIASGLAFLEGPLALPDGSLLVCEVSHGRIIRVGMDGKTSPVAQVDGMASALAFGPDGKIYFCNGGIPDFQEKDGKFFPHLAEPGPARGRIEKLDLDTGKIETVYTHCDGVPLIAPNDLVFDAHGGIWFTDHGKVRPLDRDHGALYYAKADGSFIRRMVYPLLGPNGVALSPSGDRVYVAETPTARLWGFDIGSPGTIRKSDKAELGRKGHLVAGSADYRWFDSMKVDGEGWSCVATLMPGGITAVSPDGKQVDFYPLPDEFTTNLCFGGKDLRTAFITLSSTGRVVAMDWPRPGLKLNYAP